MSGYGYHWSPCRGGGDAKAIVAGGGLLVGALAVEWLAAHAVEVLAVTTLCGALAVAAVVALMRWGDRREARHMAEHPFLVTRPVPATLTATVIPQVSQPAQVPAVEQHVHFHFDPADREAARIIRTALPGMAGEVITEGKRPMGLFSGSKPQAERQADNDRHKALKRAQDNYMPKDRNEDATARQLNAARAENEKNVSWWRR